MNREEAIEILKEFKTFCEGILWDSKYIGRVEALDMAIEALSERPKGEWIEERVKSVGDVWEKIWYRCSKCKRHEYRKTNFCPNCGADNRGEKE